MKSGNNSCSIYRRRLTDLMIVVRPSSSASNEDRQVLPEVVALAWTAPDWGPRVTRDPRTLRRRGPVAREASVYAWIEGGDPPPSTRGKCIVVWR